MRFTVHKPSSLFSLGAFVFLLPCLALGACASRPGPGPGSPAIGIPEEAAARESDLAYLVRELTRRHPLFQEAGGRERRAEFEAAAAELEARLPALRKDEAMVELARLVASLGDGHTGLVLPARSVLPLSVYRFEEGWYILQVSAAYPELLGKRLVSIAGVPVERLCEALTPIVPHDNASGLLGQLPYRLLMPEILAGLGFLAPGADPVSLVASDDEGRLLETPVRVWNYGEARPSFLNVDGDTELPLYRRRGEENYWYTPVPGTRTLYIAYNRCREDPARRMRNFTAEIERVLDEGGVDRVLVDLRNNGGGSSPLFWPLLRVLASHATAEEGAIPVFVAIGRRTFSSAILNAAELAWGGTPGEYSRLVPSAGARLVGEASGGSPNHYGELRSFSLPHSGFRVNCSTTHFRNWPTEASALEPDILLPPRWEDYRAGRDPVLEAVIGFESPSPSRS